MKQANKIRWTTPEARLALDQTIKIFGCGGMINSDLLPFGRVDGFFDMRGFPLSANFHPRMLVKCIFKGFDFSEASFRDLWIEGCVFDNCVFNKAELVGIKDHANKFINCSFVGTCLGDAGLGHKGSSYKNCLFDRTSFDKARFIRAEFDDCKFDQCRFKGVDFNASSFVNCEFSGKIEDVWFRGGFALKDDISDFGVPRKNAMKNVSFEKASLWSMTFSNQCDLSTIKLPLEGNYKLYSNWRLRLEFVKKETSNWTLEEKKQGEIFVNSYLVHAKTQDWYLLNCEETLQELGEDLGLKIIAGLDRWGKEK